MSRTIKGSKWDLHEYYGRRLGNGGRNGGYGPYAKQITHKKERMHSKRIVREQVKVAE